MAKGLTYLDATEVVLREAVGPLSAWEIIREIRNRQLIDISGKTPVKSINARLSVDIKRKQESSRFKRVAPGRYTLRKYPGKEYIAKPRQKRISPSEMVLVFPSVLLNDIGHFHGIRKDFDRYSGTLLNTKNSFLMPRLQAESDPNYKQVVSYVMVKYKDSLLRFTRGNVTNVGQYQDGQYSIGFGGHVEGADVNLFGLEDVGYKNSVVRELQEEIGINPLNFSEHNFRMVGVLNDDSTALGRRHFAFIHMLELPNPEFEKGEKSIHDLQLINIPDIANEFGGYEYWSKLCIQTYFGERLSFDCHIHSKPKFSLKNQSGIILIVGYIGSGKSEACSLLSEEFGYTLVPLSQIMQKIIGCGPIEEIGRRSLQDLGYKFVTEQDGHNRLAQGIIDFMHSKHNTKFVLDGLRYPKTYEVLCDLLKMPITVMYIESTVDNLFHYYSSRETEEYSFSSFLGVVNHIVEREIERFWPIADITVYNHGSLTSYIKTVREFFLDQLNE